MAIADTQRKVNTALFPSRYTILNLDENEFAGEGNDTILSVESLVSQMNVALRVF
jgi:hypothetical protein